MTEKNIEKEEVSELFDVIISKLRVYTAEMAAYTLNSIYQLIQPYLPSIRVETPSEDIAIELHNWLNRIKNFSLIVFVA